MESKIKELIKLQTEPVAILKADLPPANAIQFKAGTWNCVIAMLSAASKGKTAAFSLETTGCMGGRACLGFKEYELGTIEYFLSDGSQGPRAGEFYKQTPALAKEFLTKLTYFTKAPYIIFKPLSELSADEQPEAIVFLVNADQLSGLATLANYDRPDQENVKLLFGSGCAQSVLYPLVANEQESGLCYVGLTDPSARKVISKDLLSFAIPFKRYLELEAVAAESFLTKETWSLIAKRI